ncbi:hypothetical protein AAV94_02260 [Lampropedia cohaerens]|uniref:Asp/Glu racemase n=1 Tax=Lampropedia cohaerens TaxID=1610491 RepID=A0A0U1Q2T0_9BURK|nr:aspartate/glutamate racemase family protein [Lampropedia cohaerens]KKW68945.1 hypothetical protein AAV94_02260 [Lampropedia cohaerens]
MAAPAPSASDKEPLSPSKVLLINPNTSACVTAVLHQHLQAHVGTALQWQCATARFGASYIACEASYAIAAHAVLDAWADAVESPATPVDAVLVGCFGDPGLQALRELSGQVVVGLAEAAFEQAARRGRFGIVTGGARWRPILERLALALGYPAPPIHTVSLTGAQLREQPERAQTMLMQACMQLQREAEIEHAPPLQSIIIGGAALAGMAQAIQPGVALPLIDSVSAAADALQGRLRRPHARRSTPAPERATSGPTVLGLSQALANQLSAAGR